MPSLRDLGLSEYESRVYRSLLSSGPTTAKELSRASGVPMGRIYDVLADLEGAELVRSQQASRPKKYAPVEPETALSRLLEERRRELEAEMAQYQSTVEELSERLEASEPAEGQFYTVAIGSEETVELLLERLASANDRIDLVVADVSPQFDIGEVGAEVADAIESAAERGVTISALVSPEIVEASPTSIQERYQEIAEHPNYVARTTDGLAGNFNLIDRTEVVMGLPNPLAPEEPLALIALRDPAFATNLYEEFEPRWEAAAPITPSG